MTKLEKAIEHLEYAISASNEINWKRGEPEPMLVEIAKEVVEAFAEATQGDE